MSRTIKAFGKLFRTTVFKLSLVYLVLFSIGAGLVLARVGSRVEDVLDEQTTQTVNAEIRGLSEQYSEGGIRQLVQAVERRVLSPGSSLYLVTTHTGDVVVGNIAAWPDIAWVGTEVAEARYQRASEKGVYYRALVRQFDLPGGFRLLVGHDIEDHRILRQILARALGTSLFWLVLVGTLGGLFVAYRVLERVDIMSASARRIMAGDLNERLPVNGTGDELDRLAANFNAMLERIGELMTGLSEVSDNIAHDLKTPLTRLRNRAEEVLRSNATNEGYREALTGIIDESDGLIRVFNALLMITRAEAGYSCDELNEFDAGQVTADIGEIYEPLAEEQGARLEVEAQTGLTVRGNRELLGQALVNLVDNALKYGATEQGAMVKARARRIGDRVEIEVADHGLGIPAADRERVTGRFVRLENARSRPGSGLGLSLAAAVARLHHGEMRIEDNEPGLRVVITLPAMPAAKTEHKLAASG
jgi:signal transduction histidine kinase